MIRVKGDITLPLCLDLEGENTEEGVPNPLASSPLVAFYILIVGNPCVGNPGVW